MSEASGDKRLDFDVKPGRVYQDEHVKVTAFQVKHGEWPQAFGYRFDTADRTIVISGDTSPSPELIDACQKCDVLFHEAYSEKYRPADTANWLDYRSKYRSRRFTVPADRCRFDPIAESAQACTLRNLVGRFRIESADLVRQLGDHRSRTVLQVGNSRHGMQAAAP